MAGWSRRHLASTTASSAAREAPWPEVGAGLVDDRLPARLLQRHRRDRPGDAAADDQCPHVENSFQCFVRPNELYAICFVQSNETSRLVPWRADVRVVPSPAAVSALAATRPGGSCWTRCSRPGASSVPRP